MTFETREFSAELGQKVFLYQWLRGAKAYRYAATEQDVTVNFQRWLASSISHGTAEQSSEAVRSNMSVQVPMDHPVAWLYRNQSPVDTLFLTIFEYHEGEEADYRPVWAGRVTGVKWSPQDNLADVNHEPTYTSIKRTGLRRNYQRACPLLLYGNRCKVSREAFAITMTVASLAGNNLTAAGFAASHVGRWPGGYIEWEIESGVYERRFINAITTSSTANLSSAPVGLAVGSAFKAYPGCDKSLATCGGFFNNLDNNGGFPFFPKLNPFGSSPVY